MIKEKAIVYVHTDYWGALAANDLRAQEQHCLAYAEANGLKVAKVFRNESWKRRKGGLMTTLLRYVKDSAEKIDWVIIDHPCNLDSTKKLLIHKIATFRAVGLKIAFVALQTKNKNHEKNN